MLSGDLMAVFIFLMCIGISTFTFKNFKSELTKEVNRRSTSDIPKLIIVLIVTIGLLVTLIYSVSHYLPYEVAVNYVKVCEPHSRRCLPIHGLSIWLGASGISIFLITLIVFGTAKIKALKNKAG